MAPVRTMKTYAMNIFERTIPQTATIAGNVVVGPEIRNASAAPLFMPSIRSPLINGKAVVLLVYTGIPIAAAIMTENKLLPPKS